MVSVAIVSNLDGSPACLTVTTSSLEAARNTYVVPNLLDFWNRSIVQCLYLLNASSASQLRKLNADGGIDLDLADQIVKGLSISIIHTVCINDCTKWDDVLNFRGLSNVYAGSSTPDLSIKESMQIPELQISVSYRLLGN